jgi:hypothetical protein
MATYWDISFTKCCFRPFRVGSSIVAGGSFGRREEEVRMARSERFGEPYPSHEAVRERPGLQDAQVVAYFLHVGARKPADTER